MPNSGFSASRRKPGCARSHFSHGLLDTSKPAFEGAFALARESLCRILTDDALFRMFTAADHKALVEFFEGLDLGS